MPDPDRRAGERWESDAYRRNARDTRYSYRWNADRFEDRFRDRRDRDEYERGYMAGRFDRDAAYHRDRGYDNEGPYYEGDMGWRGDLDRAREFGGRGYERDWRDRQRLERDRAYDDWDRGRNRRW